MKQEINLLETQECCGKKMKVFENMQTLMQDITEQHMALCPDCGRYIGITRGYLPEEEIENLMEGENERQK